MSLPSTMKAVCGTAGSAVALLATAATPEQVIACGLAGLSDLGTWLVPNDLEHPSWLRRTAKTLVSAAGVGLAAVPLALSSYEGAGGVQVSVHGLLLQLDAADWQTLGVLAARTALVALLANGPDERTGTAESAAPDAAVEREVVDLDPRAYSSDPLPAAPDGVTLTGILDAVPAEPAQVPHDQAAALAVRPDRFVKHTVRELDRGRHQAQR